jgi:uncharacterized cupin superfamily protein
VRSVDLNVLTLVRDDDDPPGYEVAYARLSEALGAEKIGGTVYELEPGNANCPYHYEWGNEEWLLVLSGVLTVRHPGGEDDVGAGRIVCFPDGPDGAHKLSNRSGAPTRFLVISTKIDPSASVYPDSGKIGMWVAPGHPDNLMARQERGVDYWDGELTG